MPMSASGKLFNLFTLILFIVVICLIAFSSTASAMEDNDNDFSHATQIWNYQPVNATLDIIDDQLDIFKVHVDDEESLDVDLWMQAGVDFDMYVYNETELISISNGVNTVTGDLTEHVSVPFTSSGWYYVEVISFEGSGNYQIQVRTVANWTVMVYMSADNNLEEYGILDFMEMSSVGSNPELNIIVQIDRFDGNEWSGDAWQYNSWDDNTSYGNWTGAYRYRVTEGMSPTTSEAVQSMGEVNMGDPDTLYQYMTWGKECYPAHNYALIFWDHGGQWTGVCWDDSLYPVDRLTMGELNSVFDDMVTHQSNFTFDIIGFDACLMSGSEIAYELYPYCDYIVGSEINEPGPGWDYRLTMQRLADDPALSPLDLSVGMVEDYIMSYENPLQPQGQWDVALSLIDAHSMPAMASALDDLLNEMRSKENVLHNYYQYCRDSCIPISNIYIDLPYFVSLIQKCVPDASIQAKAGSLLAMLDSTVILSEKYNLEGWIDLTQLNGISIYYPATPVEYRSAYHTTSVSFAQATYWNEFLSEHYSAIGTANEPVTIQDFSPMANPTITEGSWQTFTISAYDPDGDQLTYHWYVDGVDQGIDSDGMLFDSSIGSSGIYHIMASIWDGATLAQQNWTIRVEAKADLVVYDHGTVDVNGDLTDQITSGQDCTVFLTIANQGEANVTAFLLNCSVDSVPFCSWSIDGLDGGNSLMINLTLVLSDPGLHTISFNIDPMAQIDEADEANNELSLQIEVVAAQWTVLVYIDGDNDLEPYMLVNFLQMACVGSDTNVNVVVQMDRIPGYDAAYGDWTTCKRFLVLQGDEPIASNAISDLGEVNMGDGTTLESFLTWGASRFQAEKYMVVLKDHGTAWVGCCFDDSTSDFDYLDLGEISDALALMKGTIGHPVDVLVFDACLMGSIEVVTQMDGLVDYMVAVETIGWTCNINYTVLLGILEADPEIGGEHLAIAIAQDQILIDNPEYVTQCTAVYDVQKTGALKEAFNEYCIELSRCLNDTPRLIQLARFDSEYMPFANIVIGEELIDLYQFVENSMAYADDAVLTQKGQKLLDILSPNADPDSIILMYRNTTVAGFCHGMSIYLPLVDEVYYSLYLFCSRFAAESVWHDIILRYVYDTPPMTQVHENGTVGGNDWYASDVGVSFSTFESSGLGTSWTKYSLDGGDWITYMGPFNISESGSHILSFYSLGMNGVTEEVRSIAFSIDVTAPSVACNMVDYDLTLDPSDADSGIQGTYYRIDSGAWTEYCTPFSVGPVGWKHVVQFYTTDNAGLSSLTQSVTVGTNDTIAPVSDWSGEGQIGTDGWFVSNVTLTLSSSDVGGSGLKTIQYSLDGGDWHAYATSIVVNSEGVHTLRFYAEDNYGNTESERSVNIKIDQSAPLVIISATGPGTEAGFNGTVTVVLEAFDEQSGIGSIHYRTSEGSWNSYSGTFMIETEGSTLLEWYATDSAGNSGTVASRSVTIDSVDPTCSFSVTYAHEGGWLKGTSLVRIIGSDDGAGISEMRYRIDGSAWTAYGQPFPLTNGSHVLECYAVDRVNNTGTLSSLSLNVDTDAPVTSIEAHGLTQAAGEYLVMSNLTLTCTDTGTGVNVSVYQIDGGIWTEWTGPLEIVQPGDHFVRYRSFDNVGNAEDVKEIAFKVVSATVPGEVIGLTVVQSGDTFILTWETPESGGIAITGYKVYRSVDNGPATLVMTTNDTTCVDTGVEPGKGYRYHVIPVNMLGEGGSSLLIETRSSSVPSGDQTPLILIAIIASAMVVVAIVQVRRRGGKN